MSYNIHIIDDDPISQMLAKRVILLTNKVRNISTFPNGQEAIDFLRANALNPTALPDIIFLDISMPVLDGWGFVNEFAKSKLSFCKKSIIYMLSSSITEADMNKASKTPEIYRYLTKPLKRDTMLAIGATWETLVPNK